MSVWAMERVCELYVKSVCEGLLYLYLQQFRASKELNKCILGQFVSVYFLGWNELISCNLGQSRKHLKLEN